MLRFGQSKPQHFIEKTNFEKLIEEEHSRIDKETGVQNKFVLRLHMKQHLDQRSNLDHFASLVKANGVWSIFDRGSLNGKLVTGQLADIDRDAMKYTLYTWE